MRSKNDNIEMVTSKKQLESEELKNGRSPTLPVGLKVGNYNDRLGLVRLKKLVKLVQVLCHSIFSL